jgi:hypothetical protein
LRVPVCEVPPTVAVAAGVVVPAVVVPAVVLEKFEELAGFEALEELDEEPAPVEADEVDPAGGQASASSTASCFFAAVTAASSVVSSSRAADTPASACSRFELFVA